MEDLGIGIGDLVSLKDETGLWKIVGLRDDEPRFEVQLGLDAATKKFAASDKLTIIQKAKRDDDGPRIIPTRSIMG
jgi:hypothetical protein